MFGFLKVVMLTPKPSFLALSSDERRALLENIAAPLQEWTGADGGVCFSERFAKRDGSSLIVVGITMRSAGVALAFKDALSSPRFEKYFESGELTGEILGTSGVNDPVEARTILERILKPFLEV